MLSGFVFLLLLLIFPGTPNCWSDELKDSGFGDEIDREKIRHQIMNY